MYKNFLSATLFKTTKENVMLQKNAKFSIGQVIHHTLFDYRGVIVDIDAHFRGSESWYQNAAHTKPPKDSPWYHVLVDGDELATYVAEKNLEPDDSDEPIRHRELALHFDHMENGSYISLSKSN
jgi:heat shock protein HspQ